MTEIHEYAQKDVVIMLLGNKVSEASSSFSIFSLSLSFFCTLHKKDGEDKWSCGTIFFSLFFLFSLGRSYHAQTDASSLKGRKTHIPPAHTPFDAVAYLNPGKNRLIMCTLVSIGSTNVAKKGEAPCRENKVKSSQLCHAEKSGGTFLSLS